MARLWRIVAVAAVMAGWGLPARAIPSPAFPQVGDTLRYALSNGDSAVTRVVRVRFDDGKSYATLDETWQHGGECTQSRTTLIRSDDGIALERPQSDHRLAKTSPLVCYLVAATPNDTWTAQQGLYRDTSGGITSYRLFARLEAIETVKTPAGTFPGCYRVAYFADPATATSSLTPSDLVVWYKPELGVVRSRSQRAGETLETTLVGYDTALAGRAGSQAQGPGGGAGATGGP
jgi:hypothetical protein